MKLDKIFPESATYRRVLAYSFPYLRHVGWLFFLDILSSPLVLLSPVPLKIIVDSYLNSKPILSDPVFWARFLPEPRSSGILIFSFILLLALAFARQFQTFQSNMLRVKIQQQIILDFRSKLFEHVQQLSFAYHDKMGSSDISYKIFYDSIAIAGLLTQQIIPLIVSVVSLASMLYVIWRIDPPLTLVAGIVAPLLFFTTITSRDRLRRDSVQVSSAESASFKILDEVLNLMRIVQYFGRERHEQHRFERKSKTHASALLKYTYSTGILGLKLDILSTIGTGSTLCYGALAVASNRISLGSLLLVTGYLGSLYSPIKTISKNIAAMQQQIVKVDRACSLLDVSPAVRDCKNARTLERARGEFSLTNVSFWYDEACQPVFQNLTLQIPRGTRFGIVGKTGSGKSTFVNLLPRFYDPSEGIVRLDGVDLRDYRVKDLRKQFSVVPQEPVLFSTSIAENIAYGLPGATISEIQAAAEAASAHEFINKFPNGYSTRVGQRGMSLSGGERQRIALARAFLKDAPILILDEPTSSVDIGTEAFIVDAMKRLMVGKTTFIIAHRLSTVQDCDLILKLNPGTISIESSPPRH